VTQDFAKMGSVIRVVNRLVPFAGATMGGSAKFVQNLVRPTPPEELLPGEGKFDRMRNAWAVALGTYTLFSIATYLLQKDDPLWDDIEEWKKIVAWPIIVRGDDRSAGWDGYGTGKPKFVFLLPKTPLLGTIFGTLPQSILESMIEKDGTAAKRATMRLVEELNPLGGWEPLNWLAAPRPSAEGKANRSELFGRPIEPQSVAGRVARERW